MLLIPTRVRPSPIHGLGLFTVDPVARGTPIWRFVPGFDQRIPGAVAAQLPDLAREHLRGYAYWDAADEVWVRSGDHCCFMNHADQPNTGTVGGAEGPVVTVALRALAAGEELTCDYRAFDGEAGWKLGKSE